MLAAGSGEILRAVTLAFTDPARRWCWRRRPSKSPAGRPRCESRSPCGAGDRDGRSISRRWRRFSGAGMAFICNPNNPTGGINPDAAVASSSRRSAPPRRRATSSMDEAYYDYATDPAYATAIPITMNDPQVLVSRTFSKIHGMAGIRVGYLVGHPDALAAVRGQDECRHAARASALRRRSPRSRIRRTCRQGAEHARRARTRARHSRRRIQSAAVRRQLRDGRRQARGCRLPADVPGDRRGDRPAVSAAHELRAHHDRHDGRDAEGAAVDASAALCARRTSAPASGEGAPAPNTTLWSSRIVSVDRSQS